MKRKRKDFNEIKGCDLRGEIFKKLCNDENYFFKIKFRKKKI